MLTIKKERIIFSGRETFFTRSLWQGFSLACLFHLIGLLLFKIEPFTFSGTSWTFPPTYVEREEEISHIPVDGLLTDMEKRMVTNMTLPNPSNPSLSLTESRENFSHSLFIKKDRSTLFGQLVPEQSIQSAQYIAHAEPSIQLFFSNALDSRKLLSDGIPLLNLPPFTSGKQLLRYSVQVDNLSGQIIWYESQKLNPNENLEKLAEGILKNILFQPISEGFITTGIVELVFND